MQKDSQEVLIYYPFGINTRFKIPVKDITQPPTTMCYRQINMQHVDNLVKQMVDNPSQNPEPADLVAYNPQTCKPLQFKKGDQAWFNSKIKDMNVFTISGQHSTLPARNTCDHAKTDVNLNMLAEKLVTHES